MTRQPVISSPASAPRFLLVGDPYTILLTGEQTGGAFALIHATVAPGFGPPPHLHLNEDETFFVLAGQITFFLDKAPHILEVGSVLHIPRNVPHYFINSGTAAAAFLVEVTPAGHFDNYIRAAGTPLPDDYIHPANPTPPTPDHIAKVLALGPQFGIRFV